MTEELNRSLSIDDLCKQKKEQEDEIKKFMANKKTSTSK